MRKELLIGSILAACFFSCGNNYHHNKEKLVELLGPTELPAEVRNCLQTDNTFALVSYIVHTLQIRWWSWGASTEEQIDDFEQNTDGVRDFIVNIFESAKEYGAVESRKILVELFNLKELCRNKTIQSIVDDGDIDDLINCGFVIPCYRSDNSVEKLELRIPERFLIGFSKRRGECNYYGEDILLRDSLTKQTDAMIVYDIWDN